MADKPQAAGGLGRFQLKRLVKDWVIGDDVIGIPADRTEFAPLWDLVADAARAAGVAAPSEIVLGPYGEISLTGTVADGFSLRLGAPLILAMPAIELKAVVAHCLVVLREPDPELADGLVRTREKAHSYLELGDLARGTTLGQGFRRVLDRSDRFHDDIERRADRAAAAAAGSGEQALIAMVRARAIREHFAGYAPCYLLASLVTTPPGEVFAEWLRVAGQPVPDWAVDAVPLPELATRKAFHPGLRSSGDSVDRARRAVNPLVPASGEPVIGELDAAIANVLTEDIDLDPEDDFTIGYEQAGLAVIEGARSVLGRTAKPADVVGLVAEGRGAELATAWYEIMAGHREARLPSGFIAERFLAADMEPASTLGEALKVFLVAVATPLGYKFEPPIRPGELTAEDGSSIKMYDAVSQAVGGATHELERMVSQLTSMI